MKNSGHFGLAVLFTCLLAAGCHSAGRCPGGCPGGSCPAPRASAPAYVGDEYSVPQGSGGRPQPMYQAPSSQGSGSR